MSQETHLSSLHTLQLCRQRRWVHTYTILYPSKKDLQLHANVQLWAHLCTYFSPLLPTMNNLYIYKKKKKKSTRCTSSSWCNPTFSHLKQLQRLCCLDLALSGPAHGASVWNDVEGQTGDCGCRISITSEGTEAPVCHLRCDSPPALYPVNWQDVLKVTWAMWEQAIPNNKVKSKILLYSLRIKIIDFCFIVKADPSATISYILNFEFEKQHNPFKIYYRKQKNL